MNNFGCWQGFLKKLKIALPYGPVIPLLGIYPKESQGPKEVYVHHVQSSIIHSSQNVETTQLLMNG